MSGGLDRAPATALPAVRWLPGRIAAVTAAAIVLALAVLPVLVDLPQAVAWPFLWLHDRLWLPFHGHVFVAGWPWRLALTVPLVTALLLALGSWMVAARPLAALQRWLIVRALADPRLDPVLLALHRLALGSWFPPRLLETVVAAETDLALLDLEAGRQAGRARRLLRLNTAFGLARLEAQPDDPAAEARRLGLLADLVEAGALARLVLPAREATGVMDLMLPQAQAIAAPLAATRPGSAATALEEPALARAARQTLALLAGRADPVEAAEIGEAALDRLDALERRALAHMTGTGGGQPDRPPAAGRVVLALAAGLAAARGTPDPLRAVLDLFDRLAFAVADGRPEPLLAEAPDLRHRRLAALLASKERADWLRPLLEGEGDRLARQSRALALVAVDGTTEAA